MQDERENTFPAIDRRVRPIDSDSHVSDLRVQQLFGAQVRHGQPREGSHQASIQLWSAVWGSTQGARVKDSQVTTGNFTNRQQKLKRGLITHCFSVLPASSIAVK